VPISTVVGKASQPTISKPSTTSQSAILPKKITGKKQQILISEPEVYISA
jgi:hypothetical protein